MRAGSVSSSVLHPHTLAAALMLITAAMQFVGAQSLMPPGGPTAAAAAGSNDTPGLAQLLSSKC